MSPKPTSNERNPTLSEDTWEILLAGKNTACTTADNSSSLARNKSLFSQTNTLPSSATHPFTDIINSKDVILFLEDHTQNTAQLRGWSGLAKLKLSALDLYGKFRRAVAWILIGVVLANLSVFPKVVWILTGAILIILSVFRRVADWNHINNLLRRKRQGSPQAHALAGLDFADHYSKAPQPKSMTSISQQKDHKTTASGTNSLHAPTSRFPNSNENSKTAQRKSSNPVPYQKFNDRDLDIEHLRLNTGADSVPELRIRQIRETANSIKNSVKLKDLLENNIKRRKVRFRQPTDRPTLDSQRALERRRQCRAEFMDMNKQWHPCHVLFDNWCDRDVISTSLIRPLIDQGKVEEFYVPETAVEELQAFLPSPLHALESYVLISGLRLKHKEMETVGIKELYVIPNEKPFIIISPTSMEKHNIHLGNFPIDEGSPYLEFPSLQLNAGVVKYEKGKRSSEEDQEHKKKSIAKHAEIRKRREEARNAEANYSTSTTVDEETRWSDPTTTSQNSSRSSDR